MSLDSASKLGVPMPVAGSHPVVAAKPWELPPVLQPVVTSLNAVGF